MKLFATFLGAGNWWRFKSRSVVSWMQLHHILQCKRFFLVYLFIFVVDFLADEKHCTGHEQWPRVSGQCSK